MIEITNITKGPVQILIRTRQGKKLTCKNIPGIGRGHNVFLLEDERHTEFVDRAEKAGLITQKKINTKVTKGE